nr:immunoglobulin light chain junction region [Macaca mulatta]
CLQGDSTPYSF